MVLVGALLRVLFALRYGFGQRYQFFSPVVLLVKEMETPVSIGSLERIGMVWCVLAVCIFCSVFANCNQSLQDRTRQDKTLLDDVLISLFLQLALHSLQSEPNGCKLQQLSIVRNLSLQFRHCSKCCRCF
jgi:hypothetical protein